MEWFKNLDDDKKNTLFVFTILAAVLIFVSWTKGCFSSYGTKSMPVATEQKQIVQPTAVAAESIETRLAAFLADSNLKIDDKNGNWFDFDKINFKSGTAKLTTDSEVQLVAVSEVIKKSPRATFKIGGYTDNTGDEKLNLQISDARAKIVLQKLISYGVPEAQLTGAEGYGSAHPVADNATPEGREKNRRISLRVKSK